MDSKTITYFLSVESEIHVTPEQLSEIKLFTQCQAWDILEKYLAGLLRNQLASAYLSEKESERVTSDRLRPHINVAL